MASELSARARDEARRSLSTCLSVTVAMAPMAAVYVLNTVHAAPPAAPTDKMTITNSVHLYADLKAKVYCHHLYIYIYKSRERPLPSQHVQSRDCHSLPKAPSVH